MAEYVGNLEGLSHSVTRDRAIVSGVTLTDGDFVYQTGGAWSNASIAGKRLDGTVIGGDSGLLNRTYSATATGNAGQTVRSLVNIEKDARYLVKMGGTGAGSFAAADEGSYFDLTGATGAQVADYATKSATTGQLLLLKCNPGIRGTDSTYGLFVIAENHRTLGI